MKKVVKNLNLKSVVVLLGDTPEIPEALLCNNIDGEGEGVEEFIPDPVDIYKQTAVIMFTSGTSGNFTSQLEKDLLFQIYLQFKVFQRELS